MFQCRGAGGFGDFLVKVALDKPHKGSGQQVAGVAGLAPTPSYLSWCGWPARPAGLASVPIYCSMILHLISYHIVSLSNPSFTRSAHHSCEMGEQSLDEPRFWSE